MFIESARAPANTALNQNKRKKIIFSENERVSKKGSESKQSSTVLLNALRFLNESKTKEWENSKSERFLREPKFS